ncbi:cytochrome P450 [Candidatus Marimicrobium litorale]|uniref:Cytochrome P450 n=1 Tax=Candidatus Marimicrobium litorale TaxID=2518991 RepID=A0ABT3T451_9GAMM|nr:cytochrome P450 [Candidatus Marimicrobium litorale]MCX2976935.1 cytochrome P450 [Candidatus Marimicrobium litorale]
MNEEKLLVDQADIDEHAIDLEALLQLGPMAPVSNPYRIYAALRRDDPVIETTDMMPADAPRSFLITRYADVRSTLKNDKVFSSDIVQRTMGIVMGPTVVGMDGKEHLKHRTLITPSMAPRVLRDGGFQETVRRTADRAIDVFISEGEADLHCDFCFQFPLAVFVSLLGLPADELGQVHQWGRDLCLVAHDPATGLLASEKLLNYLTPIVQAKREKPESDMIGTLVTAEIDGEQLSDFEVVSFLRLLVLAGAETTNHLLGTACFAMLNDPQLMERVRIDRTLVTPLINEAMRWESPISTVMREAAVDTKIAGVSIPAGASVLCHIGAANRDERQFTHPDLFDIDRADNEHISFGYGPHYCAGSHLAKLEAEVALNAILDRLHNLRVAPGGSSRMIGFSFRGPDSLPVIFDHAEASC